MHKLFTIGDINNYLPSFSLSHNFKILEILHEIFDDISEINTILEIMQDVDQSPQVDQFTPDIFEQYEYDLDESNFSDSLDTDEC